MTIDALLVGPSGHGGEGVYVDGLCSRPPVDVHYDLSGGFHRSADGAACRLLTEVALNQVVHPLAIPDMGFRALRLKRRYDLVHVHAHPVLLSGLGDVPLVMSEGSSSAVYLGDYLGWPDERLSRRYARTRTIYRRLGIRDRLLTMERAFRVYVFSDWAREVNLRWGADPEKIVVIPPGFETPPAPGARSRPEGTFTFLFVGSDFERKGGFEVIEAFAQLAAARPEVSLRLAGTDPFKPNPDRLIHSWVSQERQDAALATLRELEANGRITRDPWVSQRELRDQIFPAADAVVMPTHAEGFGFTNVEAMSFGLPVITSHVGPMPELIKHDLTGVLVPPGDSDEIARAMFDILRPGRAEALGRAARQDFLERFTRERFQRNLGDLYQQALAS